MPETPDNQRAYPQRSSQQEGIGFLKLTLSCAATGEIIKALIGPAKGKATGKLSQMRTLARQFDGGRYPGR